MKRYYLVALAAALLAAPAAGAKPLAPTAFNTNVRHYVWSSLSLPQRIDAQQQLIDDDWRIITRWRSSRLAELRQTQNIPAHPAWVTVSALLPAEPATVTWRYRHMKWTERELRESRHDLANLQRRRARAPAGYPPHHALWVCIASFEGGDTSSNGTHFGKLQMTYDWMNVVPGKASDYSDAQQEWFAENAWKANGYSYSFLKGQWFAYDDADGCYGA